MTVRGWCPGLHDPMMSGDGLLARVRPRFGRLTTDQAIALDALSTSCGNGIIEITSRGNLQVRGLHTHARFVDGACEAGLGERDPVRERRRRVVAAPFADERLVGWLEQALMETAALDGLPPKFTFRVDGGPVPITGIPADVVVSQDGDTINVRYSGRARAQIKGPIGRVPGVDAIALAPKFGQFGPGELAALATRAGTDLRITPFRSMIVQGVADGFADGLNLIADPDDPHLRIVACVGAPRCKSGLGPAREVAEQFLDRLPPLGVLHISGCEKRCAFQGEALVIIPGSGAAGPSGSRAEPWP